MDRLKLESGKGAQCQIQGLAYLIDLIHKHYLETQKQLLKVMQLVNDPTLSTMPNTVECKEDDSEKEAPLYGMTIDDLHGSNRI